MVAGPKELCISSPFGRDRAHFRASTFHRPRDLLNLSVSLTLDSRVPFLSVPTLPPPSSPTSARPVALRAHLSLELCPRTASNRLGTRTPTRQLPRSAARSHTVAELRYRGDRPRPCRCCPGNSPALGPRLHGPGPPPPPSEAPRHPVGFDLGLTHLATLSDGTVVDSPQFPRAAEQRPAREQRGLARTIFMGNGRSRAVHRLR